VALHGAVRGTIDLDLVLALDRENYQAAESALLGLGFQARLPVSAGEVFDQRSDLILERNLVAWSFIDPRDPSRIVDILIVWNEATVPTVEKTMKGQLIPVLVKDRLIDMKRRSGRPQDLADIQALEQLP